MLDVTNVGGEAGDKTEFVKKQFKTLLYNEPVSPATIGTLTTKGDEVFNIIWANAQLRSSLFPGIIDLLEGKAKFVEMLNNIGSIFYGFIKVK